LDLASKLLARVAYRSASCARLQPEALGAKSTIGPTVYATRSSFLLFFRPTLLSASRRSNSIVLAASMLSGCDYVRRPRRARASAIMRLNMSFLLSGAAGVASGIANATSDELAFSEGAIGRGFSSIAGTTIWVIVVSSDFTETVTCAPERRRSTPF